MSLFTTRRLKAVAVASVLGVLLLGTSPASAAAPTLSASNLSASVAGLNVSASTTVTSSASAVVSILGICVRGANQTNVDFVKASNVTVTPAGYTHTASKTFAPGSYSYWTCAYYNGAWLTLDKAKPFVVSSNPVVDPPDFSKLPVGDLPGWKQAFADDFTTNAAAGTFGNVYKSKFATYHGFADSYNGGTYNRNILSVDNGVLDMFLHKQGGRPQVAAPAPIVTSPWAGQTYGKFTVRFKSEALSGYKTAWLLWPDSNKWAEGEIDFPEGNLNGTMWAFNHCVGNPSKNCSWVDTQVRYTSWHTVSVEWTPTRVTYLLDGQVVGNDTTNIPSTPMHWVLQTETTGPTAATQDGHLQIDWVTVYTYNPATATAAPSAPAATSGSTAPVSITVNNAQIQTASTWRKVG